ncbi:hypothetical protein NDN08_007574 [Rhodosorus marinus]|uniref:Uncharacterized protein n=1 Tax=Rhodosorus marinus TaxID=101924 RepID=A0AAV8V228_9RHOD|nr:hypothetical protein NDN08_007574 [Rhodosorus marinus]
MKLLWRDNYGLLSGVETLTGKNKGFPFKIDDGIESHLNKEKVASPEVIRDMAASVQDYSRIVEESMRFRGSGWGGKVSMAQEMMQSSLFRRGTASAYAFSQTTNTPAKLDSSFLSEVKLTDQVVKQYQTPTAIDV